MYSYTTMDPGVASTLARQLIDDRIRDATHRRTSRAVRKQRVPQGEGPDSRARRWSYLLWRRSFPAASASIRP